MRIAGASLHMLICLVLIGFGDKLSKSSRKSWNNSRQLMSAPEVVSGKTIWRREALHRRAASPGLMRRTGADDQ